MEIILLKIIPVILLFLTGILFRSIGLLEIKHADIFMKLVFNLAFPALIVISVSSVTLKGHLALFPFISPLIILSVFILSYPFGKIVLKLERKSFGVFLAGTMIMNNGFILPFIIAAYGDEGLARLSLLDLGNAMTVFTFVYFLTCRYGENSRNTMEMAGKLIKSPPIWALLCGLFLNLNSMKLPGSLEKYCEFSGSMAIPLIMISIGIYFNTKIVKPAALISLISIRVIFGFTLGYAASSILGLEGIDRKIVLIVAASPAGYNTLVFSSLEKLDMEFAASAVSYSIAAAIIYIPAMILFLD